MRWDGSNGITYLSLVNKPMLDDQFIVDELVPVEQATHMHAHTV